MVEDYPDGGLAVIEELRLPMLKRFVHYADIEIVKDINKLPHSIKAGLPQSLFQTEEDSAIGHLMGGSLSYIPVGKISNIYNHDDEWLLYVEYDKDFSIGGYAEYYQLNKSQEIALRASFSTLPNKGNIDSLKLAIEQEDVVFHGSSDSKLY